MKLRDKIIWLVAFLILVAVIGVKVKEMKHVEDITHLKTAAVSQVEEELKVELTSSSKLDNIIFEYSKLGNVSVSADKEKDVGIIYLNGIQSGFCVAEPGYSMYGIEIGKVRWGLDEKVTYPYDLTFEIDEDIDHSIESGRNDFPIFYCNWTNDDCLVVSCDKSSGYVTAITYYNDVNKVTERLDLSSVKK